MNNTINCINCMLKNVNDLYDYFMRDTAVDFNITYNGYNKSHTVYEICVDLYGHIIKFMYIIDTNILYVYDRTLNRNILKCNTDVISNIDMLFDCGVRNYVLILHNSNLLYNGNSYDVL